LDRLEKLIFYSVQAVQSMGVIAYY